MGQDWRDYLLLQQLIQVTIQPCLFLCIELHGLAGNGGFIRDTKSVLVPRVVYKSNAKLRGCHPVFPWEELLPEFHLLLQGSVVTKVNITKDCMAPLNAVRRQLTLSFREHLPCFQQLLFVVLRQLSGGSGIIWVVWASF